MSRLTTRIESTLQPSTVDVLESVKVKGKAADVYLQFANSELALRTYMQMEACLRQGSLSEIELEAVKLWVSQQTGCEFCLSVHSFKARQAGLQESLQLDIRSDKLTGKTRLDALLAVTRAVYATPGSIPDAMLDEARSAGLTDENLVDLTMAISTILFTKMTNHINDTQSSLPPAPAIA